MSPDLPSTSMSAAPESTGGEPEMIALPFTWSGKPYSVEVAQNDRVIDLQYALQKLTRVPPARQKILGLVKGKLPARDAFIKDLKLVKDKKFTLVGTVEGEELRAPQEESDQKDSESDVDLADLLKNSGLVTALANDLTNKGNVEKATKNLSVNVIHPLREGKKLLVLDLDYTILDTKPLTSGSLPPEECARPGLHDFMEKVYPYYDICIWSQTSWIWLETKLVELGMIGGHRNYQISFVLDKTCMFTVQSVRDNKPWEHSVKALQIIWNHFPQFNASNTVHIDDLSRNFALNPSEGLKIRAFKHAASEEARQDRELYKLGTYLVHVGQAADLRSFSHKDWKVTLKRLPS
ncbi:HAD-like domain-containing protein [Schizophyllum amplum]|uniref:HAD-like domain-containing protein n=1 Tax=Schizophyllum amplum TaxID=97359 RepID=A0A550C3A0_9AGAR|nr:HAD-like domain-containing protein [Auriculariopsis ampla]